MRVKHLFAILAVVAFATSKLNSAEKPASGPRTLIEVPAAGEPVDSATMRRIYDEVKTPFKYGILLRGKPAEKVDCPSVFRHGGKWFMVFIAFDGSGYETRLARSDDLLSWKVLGPILTRRLGGWDAEQAAGGVALVDYRWDGTWKIQPHEGRYWLSYLGGKLKGYETPPLSVGLAWTIDPAALKEWTRLPENPVLTPSQPDAREFEHDTLFKSHILRDPEQRIGHPFVMFYNARQRGPAIERIGIAVSEDLTNWVRYGRQPIIDNGSGISGDPQIVKIGDVWVMFYFGAFWRPKAFDTFACSRDLANWTRWTGPDLIAPTEPWEQEYAHKPWVVRHEGVVYHFYCAVGNEGRVIALATSKDRKGARRGAGGPSLREAARGLVDIGVGISDRISERANDWALLTNQFSFVTPENCMKPDPVQAAEGRFNFRQPDAFVAFAVSNQLKVCGHCLVWAKDDRTPPWFYKDADRPASRELLLRRMKTHIDTLAGRYRGRIAMWDVANEALDDGTNFLRPSAWTAACGEEFIVKAFEYAHAADPEALLIYNDYNNELPGKREKLIRLVRLLRERKAPVHAIGLQGHYEIDRIPMKDLEATLVAMRELGVKVVVSELDIDVIPRGKWWADGGRHREEMARLDPYRDGCPPEILQRQAEQYADLFRLFRKYADVIARVSFWNLHDGQSWLNGFPWKRVNYPLLFDRQGMPKPAFDAVIGAMTAPGSNPQP